MSSRSLLSGIGMVAFMIAVLCYYINTLQLRKVQSYRCPELEQERGSIELGNNPFLELNLTVWLLRSSSKDLQARATKKEVHNWLQGVAKIYKQANVNVRATISEAVVPDVAASEYERVLGTETRFWGWNFASDKFRHDVTVALGGILNHSHNDELGWHLFVAHNLPFCGVALNLLNRGRGRGCMFVRETGCKRVHTEPWQVLPVLMAHELGHTLSLEHVNDNCNLMSGPELMNGPLLTTKQSLEARIAAKSGKGIVWDRQFSWNNGVRGKVCFVHSECTRPLRCATRQEGSHTCFCSSPTLLPKLDGARRLVHDPLLECQNSAMKKEKALLKAKMKERKKLNKISAKLHKERAEYQEMVRTIKANNLEKMKKSEAKRKAMMAVLAGKKPPDEA
jgi:hypothetical protein